MAVSRYLVGDTVKLRDRKGHLVNGIVSKVYPEQWWGNTDYDVSYDSPLDPEGSIRVTEEVLIRHNEKCGTRTFRPDGLTKGSRRKRIAEIKSALEDYDTLLLCDLQSNSSDVRDDRHKIQALKRELHCLYRKEEFRGGTERISVTETYGLGLIS